MGSTGAGELPAVQLQAAISLLSSAAADRGWGAEPTVRPCRGGRIQVEGIGKLDAAVVFQAARGLVGALIDDLATVTGVDLDAVVTPWLTALAVQEAAASWSVPTDALRA
ncbi:hypothetical protein [Modestobacter sp. SSW1-42]|uniref:hypothetical protein n=1 Tax=Modestobacter sp. SSW1-42 TaxID=596372 RepID=UPI003985B677